MSFEKSGLSIFGWHDCCCAIRQRWRSVGSPADAGAERLQQRGTISISYTERTETLRKRCASSVMDLILDERGSEKAKIKPKKVIIININGHGNKDEIAGRVGSGQMVKNLLSGVDGGKSIAQATRGGRRWRAKEKKHR